MTPVKNRVIADNQQIVRVDREQALPLPELLERQVIEQLTSGMRGVKLVAISDYGKGFITRTLMTALVDRAKERGIPVIVDPKGVDFSKYRGADIIKPNLSEVYAAANLPSEAPLEQAAARVLTKCRAEVLMVTRSEAGISLFYREGRRQDFPVRVREVKDVTGAGDTVLAMLSCALASGLSIEEGVQLSNRAAGLAIERFGCARITLADLARRLLKDDVGNKVFDEEHLFALQEALKGREFALLALSGEHGLTTPVFSAIRRLAGRENRDLVVYVDGAEAEDEFIEVLSSLQEVDAVIVNKDALNQLCTRTSPAELCVFEGGNLAPNAGYTVV
jgi:D-beta-D-heptose 7-phosphate kinase/D-beta-D-heptose 1-phosphate adenosyltransferase